MLTHARDSIPVEARTAVTAISGWVIYTGGWGVSDYVFT
jgi:hypothetical protein